jgi:hypothetical protein
MRRQFLAESIHTFGHGSALLKLLVFVVRTLVSDLKSKASFRDYCHCLPSLFSLSIEMDSIDATHPYGLNAGKFIEFRQLYPAYNHNYLITTNKI